jgi:phage terminase small subunit
MGLRGPGAKPVELRLLEGTAGQVVSIKTNDIEAVRSEDLDAEGREIWDRVVSTFPPKYFKAADEHYLAAYCRATVLWQKLQTAVEDALATSEDVPKEYIALKAQAQLERTQLGDRLGIGPSKRTQSVAATTKGKKAGFFQRK